MAGDVIDLSEAPSPGSINLTDIVWLVQGGTVYKVTIQDILSKISWDHMPSGVIGEGGRLEYMQVNGFYYWKKLYFVAGVNIVDQYPVFLRWDEIMGGPRIFPYDADGPYSEEHPIIGRAMWGVAGGQEVGVALNGAYQVKANHLGSIPNSSVGKFLWASAGPAPHETLTKPSEVGDHLNPTGVVLSPGSEPIIMGVTNNVMVKIR